MRKILFLAACLLMVSAGFAEKVSADHKADKEDHKTDPKEDQKEKKPLPFSLARQAQLRSINERVTQLQDFQSCVQWSTSYETMGKCREKFRKERDQGRN